MSDQQNQPQEFPPSRGYPPQQQYPPTPGYPPSQQQLPPSRGYPPQQQYPPTPGYPPSQQQYPPPSQQQLPSNQHYKLHFSEVQMRRYFNPNPRRPLQCILAGVALLFISPLFLLLFILPILAGLTLIIVGAIWLIIKYTVRPSDEQYRDWLEERQRVLVDKSHQKSFLDLAQLESPHFIFKGSVLPNTPEARNYKEVYKKESRLGPHFSINTYLVIFLTKDNIVAFSSEINALDQMWSTNTVRYYYYEHVSGIQIADRVLEINTAQNTARFQGQVFFLLIDNGEQIGSDMVVSMQLENANGTNIVTENNDQLINRLLSLLKDHKVSRLASRESGFDNI